MANLHLVTGFLGREHITAVDQAAFNAALIGTGQFVLEKGKVFEAQVISNNQIRILDGELMMQGRFVRLDPGTYVDLSIENGVQGKKRNDLIVARYTKNAVTAIESVDLVVIKGAAVDSNPVDPSYTEGDINDGAAALHDFPLWRIPLDGLNVGEPEAMYGLPFVDSMQTLHTIREDMNRQMADQNSQYEEAFQEQNKAFQNAVDAFGGYTKAETLTDDTKALLGLVASAVPDDAFTSLGEKVNPLHLHWWRMRSTSPFYYEKKGTVTTYDVASSSGYTYPYTYTVADSIRIDSDGYMYLVNPKHIEISYAAHNTTFASMFAGKYFIEHEYGETDKITNYLHYAYPDTSGTYDDWDERDQEDWYKLTLTKVSSVTAVYDDGCGEWAYVSGGTADAYPNGVVDGVEYDYLGIPFENARVPARIVYGSYVGTGKYGANNPTSLTFDFAPKVVMMLGCGTTPYLGKTYGVDPYEAYEPIYNFVMTADLYTDNFGNPGFTYKGMTYTGCSNRGRVTNGGKTFEWYSVYDTSNGIVSSASIQCNSNGATYYYLAIG